MPTLTIEKSHLIEENPFIDEFMARVGASVERSEFYAAFRCRRRYDLHRRSIDSIEKAKENG